MVSLANDIDGFWDNGDTLILGRVSRTRIGQLNGSDWEFFAGSDGLKDAGWTRQADRAKPIVERAGKLGETGLSIFRRAGAI